jgi:endonuclease/exonuclease/phosphatase (EEP) superfamily protein YafD
MFHVNVEESPHSIEQDVGQHPGWGAQANLSERATETNRQVFLVRVKWWCKRPPATVVMQRLGNPHLEQGQAEATPSGNEAARFYAFGLKPRVDCWSRMVTSGRDR